jgi:hypothetical protein
MATAILRPDVDVDDLSKYVRPVRLEVEREMPAAKRRRMTMARYLLALHTAEDGPREPMTDEEMQQLMERIDALEQEMRAADALVYSGRLEGAEGARVVRVESGETLITDGPFAETKEQLGGFYIVEAQDMDEALSWASKTSSCIARPIEVRAFFAAR